MSELFKRVKNFMSGTTEYMKFLLFLAISIGLLAGIFVPLSMLFELTVGIVWGVITTISAVFMFMFRQYERKINAIEHKQDVRNACSAIRYGHFSSLLVQIDLMDKVGKHEVATILVSLMIAELEKLLKYVDKEDEVKVDYILNCIRTMEFSKDTIKNDTSTIRGLLRGMFKNIDTVKNSKE